LQEPARRGWFPYLAGTGLALLAAAVAFQVYHAEPGEAQSRPEPAGTAQLSGGIDASEKLAVVNQAPISWQQVATEVMERHGQEVLENIINRTLIQQECKRLGLVVSDEEIYAEVKNNADRFKIAVDAWYQLLKTERGISPAQYHRDVVYPLLALKKIAGESVRVSNQDMQDAFERDFGERINGRMILVNGNSRQANTVWNEVNSAPTEFSRIAREKSADSATRALGGVIPPIRKHGGNHAMVEQEAFKLKVGEISPLIDIGNEQYVILQCEGREKPQFNDIREVWDDLHARVLEEKTQEAVAKTFERIKSQAAVTNYLTRSTKSPSATGVKQTSGVAQPSAGVTRTAGNEPTAPADNR